MGSRVFVVSEDPLARRGLVAELAAEPDLAIAGELTPADDLSRALLATPADAVLFDLGPDPTSLLLRARELEDLSVVVLLPGPEHAAEAFAAGARGLFLRDSDPGAIAAAILAIRRGAVVLDPAIATELVRTRPAGTLPSNEVLTAREREVLARLAEGLSNKAIAKALDVTEHTAKFHVTAIMNKLGAETRTEAVVLAARLGLVVL
jgi:DNA-binding NarL/FixJ family response regulator